MRTRPLLCVCAEKQLLSPFHARLGVFFGLPGRLATPPVIQGSNSHSRLFVPHLLRVITLENPLSYLLSARPFELNIRFPVVTSSPRRRCSYSRAAVTHQVSEFHQSCPTCDGSLLQPLGNFRLTRSASAQRRRKLILNYKPSRLCFSTCKYSFISRKHEALTVRLVAFLCTQACFMHN